MGFTVFRNTENSKENEKTMDVNIDMLGKWLPLDCLYQTRGDDVDDMLKMFTGNTCVRRASGNDAFVEQNENDPYVKSAVTFYDYDLDAERILLYDFLDVDEHYNADRGFGMVTWYKIIDREE